MYLIKTMGKGLYSDCIQIRDKHFALVKYCKINQIEKYLKPDISEKQKQAFFNFIENLPPGKIKKYSL